MVYCLTSYYNVGFIEISKNFFGNVFARHMLPGPIHNYNLLMGSVDKTDQLLEPYSYDRKSLAWYKKLGIHFVFRMLLNALLLYTSQETRAGRVYKKPLLVYTQVVAEELIYEFSPGGKILIDLERGGPEPIVIPFIT